MSATLAQAHPRRELVARWLTRLGLALAWLVLAVLSLWAMAALSLMFAVRTQATADDFVRSDPRRDFGQVQTAHSSALLCFGCFCVVSPGGLT